MFTNFKLAIFKRIRSMCRYALVIVLVLVLLFLLGCFHGTELQFSPQTLQCRVVNCYYIYSTDIVIWRRFEDPYLHPLVSYWQDVGYDIAPADSRAATWDTISISRRDRRVSYQGLPSRFWRYCQCDSEQDAQQWIDWSTLHPDLANDLWPKVIGLLHLGRDRYDSAALLMSSVQGATTRQEYNDAIKKWHEDSNNTK